MANLKWDIEVEDRASANAKKISANLRRLEKRLLAVDAAARGVSGRKMGGTAKAVGAAGSANRTSAASARFGTTLDKLTTHFGGAESGARKLGGAIQVLEKRLAGAATKIAAVPEARGRHRQSRLAKDADGGTDFGEVLSKTFFALEIFKTAVRTLSTVLGAAARTMRGALDVGLQKTRQERGFELQLGKAGGKAFAKDLERFAEQFGLELEKVRSQGLNLLNRGFDVPEAFNLMQAVADLDAVGIERIDDIVMGLAQMKSKGVASMEELQQQLGEKLNVGGMLDAIAKRIGVEDGDAVVSAMVESISGGIKRGGGDKARKLISEGKVSGEDAYQGALDFLQNTFGKDGKLGGTAMAASQDIDKLENRLANRKTQFLERADLSGLTEAYTNTLTKLLKLLDPDGPFGKRIQDAASRFFGIFERFLERYSGDEGFKRLEQDLDSIITKVEQLVWTLEKLAPLVELVGGVTKTTAFGPTKTDFSSSPVATTAGTISRFTGGQFALDWLVDLFRGDPEAAADAIGAKKHAAGGLVTRPHLGLVGERGPELIVPLSKLPMMRGGGGSPTVNLTFNIPGATKEDAEHIGSVVRREVDAYFAEAALSGGL